MSMEIAENALYDLEWDRVTDALAGYAVTFNGRAKCLNLDFFESVELLKEELGKVAEYRKLLEAEEGIPLSGVSYKAATFATKADKGGRLSIAELNEVAQTIRAGNRIGRRMQKKGEQYPLLCDVTDGIEILHHALKSIDHAIDPAREELKDNASQSLGALRKKARNLHEKVKRKLNALLESERLRPHLRDSYYTIREERYVLPVKVSERSGVKGIVHGSSGSGQTLFVEPKEMVQINNDLLLAEMEVEREEARILGVLSAAVGEEARAIHRNLKILASLDVIQAKARFADSLNMSVPKIRSDAVMNLLFARHPLLAIKGVKVVKNDYAIGEGYNALVLSGANTGGKTVALKTMGLCALMAWAGLPIPAEAGSVVGRFEKVFTVMGDEQSLSDDLSTFSANINNLNRVLDQCDERSLILLDEIVVGTDPKQGAALAQAIVEGMAEKRARIIVTTHYERLKRLAYAREDFENAAVGLSEESLKPTYRVTLGVPGQSAAFRIAKELAIPDTVVARAQSLVKADETDIDKMVENLQEEIGRQKDKVARLERIQKDFELKKAIYERKLRLVESREKEEIRNTRRDVIGEIDKAKQKVREIVRTLQKGGNLKEANEALEELKTLEAHTEEKLEKERTPSPMEEEDEASKPNRKRLPESKLVRGEAVYIENLGQRGVIAEPPDKRGLALIEVGRLKMRIPKERLFALEKEEKKAFIRKGEERKSSLMQSIETAKEEQSATGGSSMTCDLRGERVDESLDKIDGFLDRAFREKTPYVYIIHGHGTGRLKLAVRQHLKKSPYVKKFRPGERGEGQDGVTVAFLRDEG